MISHNLLKPLSGERANAIRDDLIEGLSYAFIPSVNVSECTVVPDYERSTYWITLRGFCPSLRVNIYDKIGLKSLV